MLSPQNTSTKEKTKNVLWSHHLDNSCWLYKCTWLDNSRETERYELPHPLATLFQPVLLPSISGIPSRKVIESDACMSVCMSLPLWVWCRRLRFDPWVQSLPGLGRSLGEGIGYPLQYSCLENPMGRGAWWSMVHRVTKRVCVNVCESVRLWLCTAAFNTDTKSTHAEHTLSDLIVFSSFLELFFTSTIRSIPFFSMAPWDVTLGLCHDLFDLDR